MDKTTVFNLALSLIGESRYVADSGVVNPCELWFPTVLREAGVRHNWTFTRKITTLTRQTDGTYHLPSDCMNIMYLRDSSGMRPSRLTVIDRKCHTDLSGVATLVYQSSSIIDSQELPDDSPEFCTGVAYLLAARIARAVTGTHDSAEFCEQMAEVQFLKAITRDAQQEASNKTDPFLSSDPTANSELYY